MIGSLRLHAALVLLAAAGLSAAAAAQEPADVLYAERSKALALDAKCGLLDDGARAALQGGAVLARNALLRADWSYADVASLSAEGARRAAAVDCVSPEASDIAARVLDAYLGWRRLKSMTFAGDQRVWTADRPLGTGYAAWLVTQNVSASAGETILFGLARDEEGRIRPALAAPARLRVRVAHLHARDFAVSIAPVSQEYRRLAGRGAPLNPLAAAAPPDVFTIRTWASGRQAIEAGAPLAKGFDEDVAVIWYPQSSVDALAALDPRESAYIDIEYAPRGAPERRERLYIEIGDFAVARMFVDLARHADGGSESDSANPAALIR